MAWAVPLLCSGCFSKLLVDWANARVPLESHVTRVEASRVAPQVFALRVVDVAEDGRRRQRDFFWAPGAPAPLEEIARVTSSSVAFYGSSTLVESLHTSSVLRAAAVPVVLPEDARDPAEVLVLRDGRLELWREAEQVESVDLLWPTQEGPSPGVMRRLALGLGVPLTFVVDVATFPIQYVVAIIVFAAHGGHVH